LLYRVDIHKEKRLEVLTKATCLLAATWILGAQAGAESLDSVVSELRRLRELPDLEDETRMVLGATALLLAENGLPHPWPELTGSSFSKLRHKANAHLNTLRDFGSRPILEPLAQAEARTPRAPEARPKKDDGTRLGRNDPCPCGSGKKYKKCCMHRS